MSLKKVTQLTYPRVTSVLPRKWNGTRGQPKEKRAQNCGGHVQPFVASLRSKGERPRREAHRSHEARQPPLSTEQAQTVQAPTAVHTALQHVHAHHAGVHRVWVLPHGGLDHRVPGMAGKRTQSAEEVALRLRIRGSV